MSRNNNARRVEDDELSVNPAAPYRSMRPIETAAENVRVVSFREDGTMPCNKKRRAAADVTVVVGKGDNAEIFHHYSHILCFASDYFDVALHSGLKESQERKFEFPDRSPQDWKLFMSFLEPCSQAKIDRHNVHDLIPWFHHFRVSERLKECEKIYQMDFLDIFNNPSFSWEEHFENVLSTASFCSLYSFSKTQNWIIKQIKEGLAKDLPLALLRKSTHIPKFCELLQQDEIYLDGLLGTLLEQFFPKNILIPTLMKQGSPKSILDNALFPVLLRMGLERYRDQKEHARLKGKMETLVETGKDLPRRLGNALPKGHALKKKDASISALAEKRLKELMRANTAWAGHLPPSPLESDSEISQLSFPPT